MPEGTEATLDDTPLSAAGCGDETPIGEVDGVRYAEVQCPITEGTHNIVAPGVLIQAIVYGYANGSSYSYVGSSNIIGP